MERVSELQRSVWPRREPAARIGSVLPAHPKSPKQSEKSQGLGLPSEDCRPGIAEEEKLRASQSLGRHCTWLCSASSISHRTGRLFLAVIAAARHFTRTSTASAASIACTATRGRSDLAVSQPLDRGRA